MSGTLDAEAERRHRQAGDATGDAARDISQRVFFPVGATVDSELTVAMNDDTLYGYVQGAVQAAPAGMTFAYASNRPSRGRGAGAGGVIRTVGERRGHHHCRRRPRRGVSKSTSFAVDVVAQLADITVNGAPLTSLTRPGRSRPTGTTTTSCCPTAPAVAGRGRDVPRPAGRGERHPGGDGRRARPRSPRPAPTARRTPTRLNFARPAQSDEFNDAAPTRSGRGAPGRGEAGESGGRLSIGAEQGDLNAATNTAQQPRAAAGARRLGAGDEGRRATELRQPAGRAHRLPGRQRLPQARRRVQRRRDQRQLLATMEDFSGMPIAPARAPLALALLPTDAMTGTTHPATVTPNQSVWLKMIKTGPALRLSYSLDGTTWKLFYEVGASLKNVQAGCSPTTGARLRPV